MNDSTTRRFDAPPPVEGWQGEDMSWAMTHEWPVPPGLTDEQLLACIADDDNEALQLFYRRYAGLIFSLARRMVGDASRAEEIVQETFLRVWRMARSYDALLGRPEAWVMTIARNLAISALRKSRHALVPIDIEALQGFADTAPDPEEVTWLNARRELVREALTQLPAAQRQVVVLTYFTGLTQYEIAARTGEPLGTVKSRLRLALRRLEPILRTKFGDSLFVVLCCLGLLVGASR